MNVTAWICGDPIPGRSALDRRHSVPGITLAKNPPMWAKKLTAAKVAMIRASEETDCALALQLGVSEQTVWDVRARRTWKHVA